MQKTISAPRAAELIDFLMAPPKTFDHLVQFGQVQCFVKSLSKVVPEISQAYYDLIKKSRIASKKMQQEYETWLQATPTADDGDKKAMSNDMTKKLQVNQELMNKDFLAVKEKFEDQIVSFKCNTEDFAAVKRYIERQAIHNDNWAQPEVMLEILGFFGLDTPSTPDKEIEPATNADSVDQKTIPTEQ